MSISDYLVLNLGAGKIRPTINPPNNRKLITVNIDKGYGYSVDMDIVEKMLYNPSMLNNKEREIFCYEDAFEFLSKTKHLFDKIIIHRFLEHIAASEVLYFIYLMSTVLRPRPNVLGAGTIDIIVPDYQELAHRILNENVNSKYFERDNILTTTELLNEPGDPHASIWTIPRIKHFFELEGRFEVIKIENGYHFDGRDIYLHAVVERCDTLKEKKEKKRRSKK